AGGQVLRVPDGGGAGGVRRGRRARGLRGGGEDHRGGGRARKPVRAHVREGRGQEAAGRRQGPAARGDRGRRRADGRRGEGPSRGERGVCDGDGGERRRRYKDPARDLPADDLGRASGGLQALVPYLPHAGEEAHAPGRGGRRGYKGVGAAGGDRRRGLPRQAHNRLVGV
ncbi:MAG: hypothetical protein AVDCRST_MAG01-01-991, partial [uncultured Rubrobacteraceae bacterium]